jgi:RNA polymerase sigma factor (sigma-70 family)
MGVPAWMCGLSKYKDGVKTRTLEQEAMIMEYLPKVRRWVGLLAKCGLDMDDLIAYGNLALVKGVDYFNQEKCTTTIESYLKSCVLNDVRKAVSRYGGLCKLPPKIGLRMSRINKNPLPPEQREHAMNMRYGWRSLNEVTENNVVYRDEDDSYEEVEKLLGVLKPRHRYIVEELVIKERKTVDVSKDMKVSQQRVRQLREEAIFQLRTGVIIGYKERRKHLKATTA